MTEQPMLVTCPKDGEEYWSDAECPRCVRNDITPVIIVGNIPQKEWN